MAVLVGATIVGSGTGTYFVLNVAVGVASLALVPLLARWPVQAAVLLSLLAALSPAATPPATMAVLVVARWQRLSVAVAVAGTGIAAHLIRGAWQPYLRAAVLLVGGPGLRRLRRARRLGHAAAREPAR